MRFREPATPPEIIFAPLNFLYKSLGAHLPLRVFRPSDLLGKKLSRRSLISAQAPLVVTENASARLVAEKLSFHLFVSSVAPLGLRKIYLRTWREKVKKQRA